MILLILAVAAVLRLIGLNQSLWLDEAINVNNAAGLSFKDLIFNYSLGDFHPPLYHVLLSTWIGFFGSSEISVRIPSVIVAVATVYFTFLIAQKLFETKTGLVAATLMATAPLAIYYSQEARMYALAAFFASVSVYFFLSLLKKDTLVSWFGFISATTLMLYTDYLPYLLIPIYIVYIFINRKRISIHTKRALVPALISILAFILPWLLIFPSQLKTGLAASAASPAWAQVVGSPSLQSLAITFVKFTIGRISQDNNLIYALLFAPPALFVAFLFLLSLFRLSHFRSFLHYWLFGPIILAFILAFFIPVYAYFRLLFVLPAYYIIWASAATIVNWPPLTRILLVIALLINLTSASIYFLNPKFQREDWRSATAYIHQNSTLATLVLFESNFTAAPFDYYNRGEVKAAGAFDSSPEKIKSFSTSYDKIYLFQYLSGITDPQGQVFRELTRLGYINTTTRDFPGVGFIYEFKK
ncbi:MAG: glycosyltransferase family 39 protein [Patescibacteria group bacterium]